MPFTPFHFGVGAVAGWPVRKYLDIPVLILASVVIDLEPLLVMLTNWNYPLHGYCHTFLLGGILGLLWGLIAYQLRWFFNTGMRVLKIPYTAALLPMLVGGVVGAWLHIFFDSFLYTDIHPFWPFMSNPLYRLLSRGTVFFICDLCLISVVVIYGAYRVRLFTTKRAAYEEMNDGRETETL